MPGEYLNKRDLEKLLTATPICSFHGCRRVIKATAFRNTLIMSYMAKLGLKLSEALDLLITDVDLENCTVRVRSEGPTRARELKMKDGGLVILTERYLRHRPRYSAYLFPAIRSRRQGKRLTATSFRQTFARSVERAGLQPSVKPQSLRNTFAYNALKDGMELEEIRNILGFSDNDATRRYLKRVAPNECLKRPRRKRSPD